MRNSMFLGFLATLCILVPSPRLWAAETEEWHGARLLTGGKGYVATPLGEVHYRDAGPRATRTPFLLLHQTPWSMVEFAEIQNALAAHGYRTITLDTPGYGMSDAPPKAPSIEDLADNLVPVLDALRIRKVLVGGHHTGASIAVAFAARHSDRVAGLILHGVPLYTAAERAQRLAQPGPDRTLKPDGSHLSRYFQFILAETADPPQSPPDAFANLRNATWAVLTEYLQDRDIGHAAAFGYDMEPDLNKLKMPILVLSDREDSLHRMDQRTVKLHPEFEYREFSQGHALSLVREPERWATVAIEFARHAGSSTLRPPLP